ncbi:MAG TPA: PadR family transcriptional regulator [Acidimicrobiales bacterium]|nr:PadR family transcriptional regulator [Acidimicrobiales bacterium]
MSLRHGLLGLLADQPGSGWDLLKRFDSTLAFVWPATQSQLYTELNRMANDGLVEVTAQGARNRKEYAITPSGRDELSHWITDVTPERNRRNDAVLRVFFLWAVAPHEARGYLEREAEAYKTFHELLEQVKASTNWNETELDRYGRIALENGLRALTAYEDWARWAITQLDTHSTR